MVDIGADSTPEQPTPTDLVCHIPEDDNRPCTALYINNFTWLRYCSSTVPGTRTGIAIAEARPFRNPANKTCSNSRLVHMDIDHKYGSAGPRRAVFAKADGTAPVCPGKFEYSGGCWSVVRSVVGDDGVPVVRGADRAVAGPCSDDDDDDGAAAGREHGRGRPAR